MNTDQVTTSPSIGRVRVGDDRYDGALPFPRAGEVSRTGAQRVQIVLTGAIVVAPLAALAAVVWLSWGHAVTLTDVLLALTLYAVTCLGVTVGFHRLITHRSFTARRWLRVVLAVAGSMSFQGNVIDWVATHRRHHAFTDRPGDPTCARHGRRPGQIDLSAELIRVFERLGWATDVHWPTPQRHAGHHRDRPGPPQPAPPPPQPADP